MNQLDSRAVEDFKNAKLADSKNGGGRRKLENVFLSLES